MVDKVKLSKRARADLKDIGQYTKKNYGIEQRNKYLAQLDKCFFQLSENPHLKRERADIKSGYRSIVEGKHVIFYVVKDTNIEILNIIHGQMDPKTTM